MQTNRASTTAISTKTIILPTAPTAEYIPTDDDVDDDDVVVTTAIVKIDILML